MSWPTILVAKNAPRLTDKFALMHIALVLIENDLCEDEIEFCENWLGETRFLFQVPEEFIWFNEQMRTELKANIGVQAILIDDSLDFAPTPQAAEKMREQFAVLSELRALAASWPARY